MRKKWIVNIIGVILFILMYIGSNMLIEITSLKAFVTFIFSAFIAAYMVDEINLRTRNRRRRR